MTRMLRRPIAILLLISLVLPTVSVAQQHETFDEIDVQLRGRPAHPGPQRHPHRR